ncbi:MAG: Ion transport 2 domain protein [Paucimonas sp.]|nr:Ion transport 2 domain protein [Paucimonas sp.]
MKKAHPAGPIRPVLFAALTISIPAFYLSLSSPSPGQRLLGSLLYGLTALLIAIDLGLRRRGRAAAGPSQDMSVDIVLLFCALASALPTDPLWSALEWLLRLAFCGFVFIRLAGQLARWVRPHRVIQVFGISIILMAIAGGGFYWLEPTVLNYADGLWLAFTTGATVGYGDLVPSTPASRIFAMFIVLLGYAVFSVVTASIAALFVGEEEKRFEKALHDDIRSLREEIATLRAELHSARSPQQP